MKFSFPSKATIDKKRAYGRKNNSKLSKERLKALHAQMSIDTYIKAREFYQIDKPKEEAIREFQEWLDSGSSGHLDTTDPDELTMMKMAFYG